MPLLNPRILLLIKEQKPVHVGECLQNRLCVVQDVERRL